MTDQNAATETARLMREIGRDAYTCVPSHWQPLPEVPHA